MSAVRFLVGANRSTLDVSQSHNSPDSEQVTKASLTSSTNMLKSPTIIPTQIPKCHRCPFFSLNTKTRPHLSTRVSFKIALNVSSKASETNTSESPGLYSAKLFDLTPENVNWVLEDVRPYLISDGGNVDVLSVEDGVISLKLQGACGSCPSSTTTMKMGIERVLKEKFGDAVKDIRQVSDDPQIETTVAAVNGHLDILRPAIKNFGRSVEVISVDGGDCHVRYVGPDSIGSGIKAAIKEKFPDMELHTERPL